MTTSLLRGLSYSLFGILICISMSLAQTITSTAAGGRWNSTATWVGGTVPTASYDVVIAGPVVFANGDGSCRNLTINSGASLYNGTGYGWPEQILTVNGNVTNNGTIRSEGNLFVVKVKGNITNNGTWTFKRTELIGSGTQTLSAGSTNKFENYFLVDAVAKPALAAASNLAFTTTVDLSKSTLDMKSYSLTLVSGSANITNGSVLNAATLTGTPVGTSYPVLSNTSYSGSLNIKGRIQINADVMLTGTVTITDTIENSSGYGHPEKKLKIIGNLINNGLIRNGGSYGLALDVSGNITNNGKWQHNRTELSSSANQTMSMMQNKPFEASFSVTDSVGSVIAGSDLTMTKSVGLKNSVLDLKNFGLTLQGATASVTTGQVINIKELIGIPVSGYYPVLTSITYSGTFLIKGRLQVDQNVTFSGTVTIADTVENSSGYGHPEKKLKITGDLVNNGIIRNGGSNGLAINCSGNITNNNKMTHNRTELSGASNQTLALGTNIVFEAAIQVTDSTGFIVAGSNLMFSKGFNLNKTVLDMKSFSVTLTGSGANIYNGIVMNTKDLIGRSSPPILDNILYDGKISLRGMLLVNSNVTLRGDVTVVDTVQNSAGYAHPEKYLTIIGSLTNNGVIRDGGSNGLVLQVTGNITANKSFFHKRIQLAGSGNRTISDKLSSTTYLASGEKVILTGENFVPNLAIATNSKCQLANGANLSVLNGTIDERVDNWSMITATKKFTGAQDYSFFKARIKVLSNAAIDSVRVQSYGHQVPTSFAGAVKCYWRVSTFASNSKQSFLSMSFLYNDDLLGTNAEANLQIYHSLDSGKTWRQVSTTSNTTRDLTGNVVTLTDAFGFGDYLLSSSPDPSSVRPSIIVSIIGRNTIRIGGAPNRYTINFINNSDSPTLDFLLPVMTEKFVHIKSAELTQFNGVKEIVPIDSIMYDNDDSSAVFWVAPMNPREERSFDIIVTSDAPPINGTLESDPVRLAKTPEILIEPLTTAAGAAVTYIITKYGAKIVASGIDYLGRKVEQYTTPPPDQIDKFKQLFPNTHQELLPQQKKDNIGIEPVKKTGEKLSKILITKAMNITGGAYDIAASTVKAVKGIIPNLRARLWVAIMDDVGYFGVEEKTEIELSSRSQKKANAVRSWDPNEKVGPSGFGTKNYITSAGKMAYRILFENKKEATAPAWKVTIVDTLKAEFDSETVEFGPTSHDSAQYVWKKTRNGNIVRWEIEGIELPPNAVPPQGEGWVSFTVNAKSNLSSGTTISNAATIVFDNNNPILTNTFVNTLDYTPPTTTMVPLQSKLTASKLVVKWKGQDEQNGSGIESYTVYAQKDSGAYQAIGSTMADSMVVNLDMYSHRYSFYALAKDNVGNVEIKRPTPATSDVVNAIGDEGLSIPQEFSLAQNFPNPFNPATTIEFSIAQKTQTSLKIYDLLGREVMNLVDDVKDPGRYSMLWDASGFPSGIYFYRLLAGNFMQIRKMVILK